METTISRIPVKMIISSTDRKYGGEGNIEALAQSIKAHGLIHPLAVKEVPDNPGHYRVIAGRRRYEAIKSLNWKNVEVQVYPEKSDDEAVALAENVNREDMHPLDEAEKFKREIDSGKTAEEVAKYYARSVSGIHQRIRLTNLIDGIKTMFRDGKINLSGAALIASLPDEDQEKFLKKYGEKKADKWEITNFISTVQRLKIKHIADSKCAKCKTRTYNSTPGLFEDYSGLEDVCFNQECFAGKWKDLIAKLIAKQEGKTDSKIILNRGIPDFLPAKTKTVMIGDAEYTLLKQGDYNWSNTKKKSDANTAWLISLEWHQSSGSYDVTAERVEYKVYEKVSYTRPSSEPVDPVKKFKLDLLPDILPKEKKTLAEIMQKKHEYSWSFFNAVSDTVLDTIITNRLQQEDKESMAALYLASELGATDDEGNWHEIDPDYAGLHELIFGKTVSLSELPKEPMFENFFKMLIVISLKTNQLPEIDDSDDDWNEMETTLFWRFAQMSREEYITLYQNILTEAIRSEAGKPVKPDEETQDIEPDTDMEEPAEDE